MTIVGIDFGGTRLRAARFDEHLNMLERAETPTLAHEPQQAVIQRILDVARQVWPDDGKVEAVGISAPCPMAHTGMVGHAAVVPDWVDVPLAQWVSEAFGGVPVYMENDANLGALAEYHKGAARGANPAVYMTISTGIGGGLVIDGQLFTGKSGLAIEPGHSKYRGPDGHIYSLQDFAAGPGIVRLARLKLAETAKESQLRESGELTGKRVGEAAQAGDPVACAVIEEAGWWLGLGLINVALMCNPEVIVLGGSVVMALGDLLLDPARRVMAEYVVDPAFYSDDLLQLAHLGDDVCLIGAASYARDRSSALAQAQLK
ncbi:MAG: ROK family protein [Anaerolineae bacterium]|nr:ROK family protein [Anaerolineae bacterium]